MRHNNTEEAALQDVWLRRVARALVRDEHAAEDLAQDVWVAALRRGRTDMADRPWLGGVLRHRAFSGRRKAASRAERERGTARAESTQAADVVAEQLQLREQVTHELRALQEPYRSAVYLHVVEGLPLRKVGRKLDVATSTAHGHVRQGLERLRQRLDEAYAGERKAWLGLMIPWGQAAGFSTAWSAASLAGAGLLAAVTAVIGLRLVSGGPTTHAIEEAIAMPSVASVAVPSEALGELTPGRPRAKAVPLAASADPKPSKPRAEAAATQEGVSVQGSIKTPGGGPASGAIWKLKSSSANSRLVKTFGSPANWEDLEGVIGDDGQLDLTFEPHPSQQYIFTIDHPSFVPMRWRWFRLKTGDVRDLGDLTLEAPGRVLGTLVDPAGQPLGFRTWRIFASKVPTAGGRGLQSFSTAVETDDGGAFVLDRLPEGPIQLELSDRHLGRVRGPLVQVTAGQDSSIAFQFAMPEGTMGRVVLKAHVTMSKLVGPLAAAQFSLVGPEGIRIQAALNPAYPDAYVFEGVGDGDHHLELDDSRLKLLGGSRIARGQSSQCLVMGSAAAQLTATGPDGASIDDFFVEVSLQSGTGEPRTATVRRSGSMLKDGRLYGLVPGNYELTVRSGNLRGSSTIVALGSEETRTVAVQLEATPVITGQVRREDGSPAAGELVRLVTPAPAGDGPDRPILNGNFVPPNPDQYRTQVAAAVTDEEGKYTLALPVEPLLLVVAGESPGPMAESAVFAPNHSSSKSSGQGPVDLVLPSTARFAGRLIVPEDTNLKGWTVVFQPAHAAEAQNLATAPVQPGGHFSFDSIQPAEGRLVLRMVSVSGSFGWSSNGGLPGEHVLETLTLAPGEVGHGEYPYPGEPLTQVFLAISGAGGEGEDHSVVIGRIPHGPQGAAAANGPELGPLRLEPGSHEAWLAGTDWVGRVSTVMVPSQDGAVVPIALDLSSRRVRVMVSGTPLSSHRLSFMGAPNELTMPQLKTDAEGFIDLRLSPGEYELYPSQWSQPEALKFKVTRFVWPLPDGDTVLTLEDLW